MKEEYLEAEHKDSDQIGPCAPVCEHTISTHELFFLSLLPFSRRALSADCSGMSDVA
jgi:hypothetical protein